jgi:hypothetical protein
MKVLIRGHEGHLDAIASAGPEPDAERADPDEHPDWPDSGRGRHG